MSVPTTYEEYLAQVNAQLNWLEKLSGGATSLDEIAHATNKLLIELVRVTAEGPGLPSGLIEAMNNLSSSIASLVAMLGGGTTLENPETFRTGQKNVATAGTPEQLLDVPIPFGCSAILCAKPGNTGDIYFASSAVDVDSDSSMRFDKLEAGDSIALKIQSLKEIWIDASEDGEGVSWYVERL